MYTVCVCRCIRLENIFYLLITTLQGATRQLLIMPFPSSTEDTSEVHRQYVMLCFKYHKPEMAVYGSIVLRFYFFFPLKNMFFALVLSFFRSFSFSFHHFRFAESTNDLTLLLK